MQGNFRVVNSRQTLEAAKAELERQWETHKWLKVQITNEKQRSQLQNNALHLWCAMVATELNDNGFDVRQVLQLSSRAEIAWTGEAVKEHLWRPVQKTYMGKASTTKASTKDYPAIYDTLNKVLIEKMDVHVPWPSKQGVTRNAS